MSSSAAPAWPAGDSRRILHAVYRVGDLEKTVALYRAAFGLEVTRERDVPEEGYKNVFLAFGDEREHTALELTYNYGVSSYDVGKAFGHFAIASEDIYALSARVEAAGGAIPRPPGPVKGGSTHIAFAKDPTGYLFELIQRPKASKEPLAQVMLRVGDLQRAVRFYEEVLGARLIRTRDVPEHKYTLAFLGFKGVEEDETVFELTYNYGVERYEHGDGYAQVAVGTDDVARSIEAARAAGADVIKEATALPGIGTRIGAIRDPDGYKIVFVDNADFLKELDG